MSFGDVPDLVGLPGIYIEVKKNRASQAFRLDGAGNTR